jgi:hypothetical protein
MLVVVLAAFCWSWSLTQLHLDPLCRLSTNSTQPASFHGSYTITSSLPWLTLHVCSAIEAIFVVSVCYGCQFPHQLVVACPVVAATMMVFMAIVVVVASLHLQPIMPSRMFPLSPLHLLSIGSCLISTMSANSCALGLSLNHPSPT